MMQIGKLGSRSGVLRVQTNGKRLDIGLGSASMVSLREALEKASERRKGARAGVSPLDEKRRFTIVVPSFQRRSRRCLGTAPGMRDSSPLLSARSWLPGHKISLSC